MSISIGYTATSNNFGRYRVGKLDGDYAWIVFEVTGNVTRSSLRTIQANGVVDYKGDYTLCVGKLYNTNNYGKVRVVSITSTRDIIVEFVNTGNRVKSSKNTILAGLLTDRVAIALEEKERVESAAARRKKIADYREAERQEKERLQQDASEQKRKVKEAEKAALKAAQMPLDSRGDMFLGTDHSDNLGMEFSVVERAEGTNRWKVRYRESGNLYECSEHSVRKKTVYDRKLENFFDLKADYDKKQAALWYHKNREARIKKACDYQKNNLERSRVNNQNRRSRREGAEGRHTLEEISILLEEQNHKCPCCGVDLTKENKHLDHIYPLALGGTNYVWNLQWLCQFCNNSKSDSHPNDWEIYSKSEHFKQILASRQIDSQPTI